MRRRAIGSLCLLIVFMLASMPVQAEPLQQQRQVQITAPEINAELRGVVSILGSASVSNFQFYKVEFGVGPSPSQWAIVGDLHDQPVLNGQLEVWDTTRVPDGVYSLRLQAVKRDGNYDEFYVRQLIVANKRPTSTETPDVTVTPRFPTPTILFSTITPQATSTLAIVAPTAALAKASPTATISRPVQNERLPIEPQNWAQAFCFGAGAMGLVFVLLGIIFGLRRLL